MAKDQSRAWHLTGHPRGPAAVAAGPVPDGWPTVACRLPGDRSSDERALRVVSNTVDARFFDAMGIPIVEGRSFSEADDGLAPRVVVVSRKMAETRWPGRRPEGQPALVDGQAYEVIGVVGDIEGTLIPSRGPQFGNRSRPAHRGSLFRPPGRRSHRKVHGVRRQGVASQKLNPIEIFTVRTPSTLVGLRKNGDVISPL